MNEKDEGKTMKNKNDRGKKACCLSLKVDENERWTESTKRAFGALSA